MIHVPMLAGGWRSGATIRGRSDRSSRQGGRGAAARRDLRRRVSRAGCSMIGDVRKGTLNALALSGFRRYGAASLLRAVVEYGLFNIVLYATGVRSGVQVGAVNLVAASAAAFLGHRVGSSPATGAAASGRAGGPRLALLAAAVRIAINTVFVAAVAELVCWLPLPALITLNVGKALGEVPCTLWGRVAATMGLAPEARSAAVREDALGGELARFGPRLPGTVTPFPEWPGRWWLVGSLAIVALMVRIPWLWTVPQYVDELREVELGYLVSLGRSFPLHNVAWDIGALHNYVLALVFRVLGPGIYWSRLYVALTSAATVPLVFALGRRLYGFWVGVLAAGLLLTNGMHILVTHMAWSNATTTFFFCLALLVTLEAERQRSGPWLAAAGLAWALTLQTHASAVVYVLVVVLYVARPAFRMKTGIGGRWYLAAAAAFVAGYANMIWFNVVSVGGSLRWIGQKTYTLETDPGPGSWAFNAGRMVIELMRSLGSGYEGHATFWEHSAHAGFWVATVLLAAGVCHAFLRKTALPVWLAGAAFVVLPILNRSFWFMRATRYIMPVVVCGVVLVALAYVETVRALAGAGRFRRAVLGAAAGVAVVVIAAQLVPFYGYCASAAKTNESNTLAMAIVADLDGTARAEGGPVLVDRRLGIEWDPVPFLLTLERRGSLSVGRESGPFDDSEVAQWTRLLGPSDRAARVAVMSDDTYDRLRPVLRLAPVRRFSCEVVTPQPGPDRKVVVVRLDE